MSDYLVGDWLNTEEVVLQQEKKEEVKEVGELNLLFGKSGCDEVLQCTFGR